ncbi:hypothetical protein JXR93_10520 [bacterium]|nr:hypothetical protein [bacterium]
MKKSTMLKIIIGIQIVIIGTHFIIKFINIDSNATLLGYFSFSLFFLLIPIEMMFQIPIQKRLENIQNQMFLNSNYDQIDKLIDIIAIIKQKKLSFIARIFLNSKDFFYPFPETLLFICYLMNKNYIKALDVLQEFSLDKNRLFTKWMIGIKTDEKNLLFDVLNDTNESNSRKIIIDFLENINNPI